MPREVPVRSTLLRIVLQRGNGQGDCGIAALASYLCITYEAALLAVGRVIKGNPLEVGLFTTELMKAALRLECPLRLVAWDHVDQDEGVGILHVKGRFVDETYEDHFAILVCGKVIDCREGTLWDLDVYLRHFAADPVSLLVQRK